MPHIDIRCKKWEHDKHGAPALLLWNACHVETYIKMEIQDRWSVMELVIGEVASNMALAIHAGSMGLAWRPIQFRFFLKTLEEGKSRRSGCWTAPAPGKTYLWIPLSLQWSIEWCWIALKSCPNSIIPLPILLAAGASRKQNHQMHPNAPNIQGQTEKPLVNQGKEAQFGSFGQTVHQECHCGHAHQQSQFVSLCCWTSDCTHVRSPFSSHLHIGMAQHLKSSDLFWGYHGSFVLTSGWTAASLTCRVHLEVDKGVENGDVSSEKLLSPMVSTVSTDQKPFVPLFPTLDSWTLWLWTSLNWKTSLKLRFHVHSHILHSTSFWLLSCMAQGAWAPTSSFSGHSLKCQQNNIGSIGRPREWQHGPNLQ